MLLILLVACAEPLAAPLVGGNPALASCVVDQVVDIGMDGKAEWRWHTTFDAAGRELRTESDQGNTGRTQGEMRFYWDARGNLARREWDPAGAGAPAIITSHEYADGRKVRELLDTNADGSPEVVRTLVYEGDRAVREEFHRPDGTRPDGTTRYLYDDRGNLAVKVYTDAGQDVPGVITTLFTDRAGNLVREEVDTRISGIPAVVQTNVYDVHGRPTERRWDTDMDGRTNNFAFWAYDCPGDPSPGR